MGPANLGSVLGAAGSPTFPPPGAQVVSIQQVQQWQSPYPPPEHIKEYEAILPGTFDRIVKMAEQAQAAQIESVRTAQESLRANSILGTLLGGAVTVVAMICSLVCVFHGALWVAGAFLSVPVMSVAKAFIESAKSRSDSSSTPPPTPHQG
jgi:uncharacterized membrane protein